MPPRQPELPEGTDQVVAGASTTESEEALIVREPTARDKAVEKFKGSTEKLSGQAADKARELVGQGLERGGEALANVSKLIGDTASSLDDRLGEDYGEYARRAASAIEDAANRISAKNPDELIDDTREFCPIARPPFLRPPRYSRVVARRGRSGASIVKLDTGRNGTQLVNVPGYWSAVWYAQDIETPTNGRTLCLEADKVDSPRRVPEAWMMQLCQLALSTVDLTRTHWWYRRALGFAAAFGSCEETLHTPSTTPFCNGFQRTATS